MELRNSDIAGVGLFAIDDIKKDEVILQSSYNIIEYDDKLDSEHVSKFPRMLVDFDGITWDNENIILRYYNGIDKFMNHSCDPNTVTRTKCYYILKQEVEYEIIALKDINKNEELTCDYDTFIWSDKMDSQCSCKSNNCRKNINGFMNLDNDIKEHLYPITDPWLIDVHNYFQKKNTN